MPNYRIEIKHITGTYSAPAIYQFAESLEDAANQVRAKSTLLTRFPSRWFIRMPKFKKR